MHTSVLPQAHDDSIKTQLNHKFLCIWSIILKIIYHCKNDWFFRLWMSFYLNLLCTEREKRAMMLDIGNFSACINLKSIYSHDGIRIHAFRAESVFLNICISYSQLQTYLCWRRSKWFRSAQTKPGWSK